MSAESFSISLLLRHNFPVNRNAFGESLSFAKESARSGLALREPPHATLLLLLNWLVKGALWLVYDSPKGRGVCGVESQDVELDVAPFSRVAEVSGGRAVMLFRSVFWIKRTPMRTMERRCSFSSVRSAGG